MPVLKRRLFIEKSGNELVITISDHGSGFDLRKCEKDAVKSGHYGIFNLKERIKVIHGQLQIITQPGDGCVCIITLPPAILKN